MNDLWRVLIAVGVGLIVFAFAQLNARYQARKTRRMIGELWETYRAQHPERNLKPWNEL